MTGLILWKFLRFFTLTVNTVPSSVEQEAGCQYALVELQHGNLPSPPVRNPVREGCDLRPPKMNTRVY